jgi:p-hydroxybenzoate 3-monooxygenase
MTVLRTRTQVGIVGAGPAGLLLSHLLHREGIESVVLERRSRHEVETTDGAGVLEPGTVDVLTEVGVGERLRREGVVHSDIELGFSGRSHRIDLSGLTGGRGITIYAQHEVIKDLITARLDTGGKVVFEIGGVNLRGVVSTSPVIGYRNRGRDEELACDFVAGCDGSLGVYRPTLPTGALTEYRRSYPFGWFGVLVHAPPSSKKLLYALHERGFVLVSPRSPTLQRIYFQCLPTDRVEDWPDDRIWAEMRARLATADGLQPVEGPISQQSVVAVGSHVVAPMRFGRLFLAGDAAHVVQLIGAKGLNLALADVRALANAIADFYRTGRTELLDQYSATCIRRVWQVQRFSGWMTSLLHRFRGDDDERYRRQLAELEAVASSTAATVRLAQGYVGLPTTELPSECLTRMETHAEGPPINVKY